MVDLGNTALLCADAAGEVAEMINRERQVGSGRLADRLAVVPRLGEREQIELGLHSIGDTVEDHRALGRAGAAPAVLRGMRGVERLFDIGGAGAGDFADLAASYR